MAKDPLLRDAVKSLKSKIISTAATANAEDLAYLGSAINNIGGRATVLEVEETGDIIMQALTDHGAQVEADTIASIEATRDTAQANVTATKDAAEKSITDTKTAAVQTMTDTQTTTTDAVNAAAATAIATMTDEKNNAVATAQAAAQNAIDDSQAASHNAIQQMQAVANTVTSRLIYARKTFFYGQL